jgi:hypothetical protein
MEISTAPKNLVPDSKRIYQNACDVRNVLPFQLNKDKDWEMQQSQILQPV